MDKLKRYVEDLERKIKTYNGVYDQLDISKGQVGYQVSKGIIYDIDHLIKLLGSEGCRVTINRPERGHWSIANVVYPEMH